MVIDWESRFKYNTNSRLFSGKQFSEAFDDSEVVAPYAMCVIKGFVVCDNDSPNDLLLDMLPRINHNIVQSRGSMIVSLKVKIVSMYLLSNFDSKNGG